MTALSAPPQAPAFAGYHHLGITVRDIEVSEAWYSRVLGFVRAFVEPHREGSGYAVVMMKPGTALFLGLDHHTDADGEPFAANRTGLDHVAFGLATREDLDAWVAHLDALGVDRDPVFEGDDPAPMALVVVRDPDGIPLELIWFAG